MQIPHIAFPQISSISEMIRDAAFTDHSLCLLANGEVYVLISGSSEILAITQPGLSAKRIHVYISQL